MPLKLFTKNHILQRGEMRTPDPGRKLITRDGAQDFQDAGYVPVGTHQDTGRLEIFSYEEDKYRAHHGILWQLLNRDPHE